MTTDSSAGDTAAPNTEPLTTAKDTLTDAGLLVAARLLPEARGAATGNTLIQIATIGGDLPLTPADLVAGLIAIARHRSDDDAPAVAQRRRTCADVAALLSIVDGADADAGDPKRWAAVQRAIALAWAASSDDRQAAIAATAAREAAELEIDGGAS